MIELFGFKYFKSNFFFVLSSGSCEYKFIVSGVRNRKIVCTAQDTFKFLSYFCIFVTMIRFNSEQDLHLASPCLVTEYMKS